MPCAWRRAHIPSDFFELDKVALAICHKHVLRLAILYFLSIPILGAFAQLLWTGQTWDENKIRSEFKVKKSFFL